MSDLVERLRTERSVYDAELCNEAADRIEHLEALEQRLRAAAMEDFDRIADLEEENERLTAVIKSAPLPASDDRHFWIQYGEWKGKALAAVKEKDND